MKNLIIISLTSLVISCSNSNNSKNEPPNNEKEKVTIDTIKYQYAHLKDKCYKIEESFIPKIKGMKDTMFQKKINDILSANFSFFVKDTVKASCDTINFDDNSFKIISSIFSSDFQVYSCNDSLLSILQLYYSHSDDGGNAFGIDFSITNIDIKKKKILKNPDLGVNKISLDKINKSIKNQLDKDLFGHKDDLNYSFIENIKELNEMNFAIRNDSIVLIRVDQPSAHFSYGIYKIPIDKWKK